MENKFETNGWNIPFVTIGAGVVESCIRAAVIKYLFFQLLYMKTFGSWNIYTAMVTCRGTVAVYDESS